MASGTDRTVVTFSTSGANGVRHRLYRYALHQPFSDCDYTRRYHFVEGYCTYWRNAEILQNTTTKKIRSYATEFATKATASGAFEKLFEHFHHARLVVSYSSNSIPSREEMCELLLRVKRNVKVFAAEHRYSHGNHNHKIGDNNNSVREYLFVAT